MLLMIHPCVFKINTHGCINTKANYYLDLIQKDCYGYLLILAFGKMKSVESGMHDTLRIAEGDQMMKDSSYREGVNAEKNKLTRQSSI
ncbi:hypothetical protein B8W96_03745 [Lentilactobacillus parakefiri]|nr:hypothetical protein B8W96_03745 [Lentilactobacillus parakefiri]